MVTYKRTKAAGMASMTSLRGTLSEAHYPPVTASEIEEAFGLSDDCPCDKTDFEWVFVSSDGAPFTVYNYRYPIHEDSSYDWHIGGRQGSDWLSFVEWFMAEVNNQ